MRPRVTRGKPALVAGERVPSTSEGPRSHARFAGICFRHAGFVCARRCCLGCYVVILGAKVMDRGPALGGGTVIQHSGVCG